MEEEEEGKKMDFVGYRYWIFGCCCVAFSMDICMWLLLAMDSYTV